MTIPRLFVPDPLVVSANGTLEPSQARQLRAVLRLTTGAQITLFNDSGIEAHATIQLHGSDFVTYEVMTVEHPNRQPPLDLTVGLALLRGERFDMAVQKLTEIGVTRIVPLAAERCVVSFVVARDWDKRNERLTRIMREAAEQSERVTLVEIESPVPPTEFFRRQQVIALVERADTLPLVDIALQESLAIAIGPEGGWTASELASMSEANVTGATLGSLIYRAETAAIVAAGTLVQRAWARSQSAPILQEPE